MLGLKIALTGLVMFAIGATNPIMFGKETTSIWRMLFVVVMIFGGIAAIAAGIILAIWTI